MAGGLSQEGQRRAAAQLMERVRAEKPLVHHITNWVVTNFTANGTLAMGALPVMAHAREEAGDMAGLARAVVLNIGTLTPETVEAMIAAGRAANERRVPVVFDPVGAGATRLRTESSLRILNEIQVAVLRGNAGELAALAGIKSEVRGVESISAAAENMDIAATVAEKFQLVAAVTGAVDWVAGGAVRLAVRNGHPLLAAVTGTGCLATTAVAVYCAVADDLAAGAAGLAVLGLAAERAAEEAEGPGTFQARLMDALYNLKPADVLKSARIEAL